jgi:hypothetical protein
VEAVELQAAQDELVAAGNHRRRHLLRRHGWEWNGRASPRPHTTTRGRGGAIE